MTRLAYANSARSRNRAGSMPDDGFMTQKDIHPATSPAKRPFAERMRAPSLKVDLRTSLSKRAWLLIACRDLPSLCAVSRTIDFDRFE